MLTNIIDRRKRYYRYKKVNAVIEPTRNDNSVKNADRAKRNPKMDKAWLGYDDKEHVSVLEAVVWAAAHQDEVTLYLYDKDAGCYEGGGRHGRAVTAKRKRKQK